MVIKKSEQPLAKNKEIKPSRYSIQQKLQETTKVAEEIQLPQDEEQLPNQHFTETDLQTAWAVFLQEIQQKDVVIYNAISGFRLRKVDEAIVRIAYPSDTAKSEFDKVSHDFFTHFRHKVNNYRFGIEYVMDNVNLKKEVMTKRTLFEKYVQINPLLKDLDDLFKFDLN